MPDEVQYRVLRGHGRLRHGPVDGQQRRLVKGRRQEVRSEQLDREQRHHQWQEVQDGRQHAQNAAHVQLRQSHADCLRGPGISLPDVKHARKCPVRFHLREGATG